MGWIDCLARGKNMGRGILMAGRWAEASEAPSKPPSTGLQPSLRFDWPSWVLNGLTIRAFNELYYRTNMLDLVPSLMRRARWQHRTGYYND